jgi:LL-diaminopimelate aminotransferase
VRELKVAYVIIPHTLRRNGAQINALFCARQSISATPPSFIMQRAAELILRREARMDVDKLLHRIKKVSRRLSQGLTEAGIPHTGGQNAPFLWAQCPRGMSAWAFFDFLLEKAHCVVTPGSNFGYGGERFFRLTAFGMPNEAEDAMLRFQVLLSSSQSVRASAPSEEEIAKRLFSE